MVSRAPLAPPVRFESAPTALLALILLLPWLAGALVLALAWAGLPRPAGAGLLVLLGISALASWRFWRGQVPRLLIWDGGNWLLVPSGATPDARRHAVRVEVAVDLQRALLIRSRIVGPPGPSRWLWLQRAGDGRHWHALRCAVHAVPRQA